VTNAKGDQVERLPESSNVWDGAFPTRHEGPPLQILYRRTVRIAARWLPISERANHKGKNRNDEPSRDI
jgi:hypothetical protein